MEGRKEGSEEGRRGVRRLVFGRGKEGGSEVKGVR
jgi:hypothetical protein